MQSCSVDHKYRVWVLEWACCTAQRFSLSMRLWPSRRIYSFCNHLCSRIDPGTDPSKASTQDNSEATIEAMSRTDKLAAVRYAEARH